MALTDAIDAVVDCCAGADVLVVGASVVLVLVLELVLVSGGRLATVVAVVTDAACTFAVPPPSDEQAARVKPSASTALTRPRGRLSIPITAFDCSRAAIVPHFFHFVDKAQVPSASRRYLFCLGRLLHRGGSP
jgi:hypothetical protein